MTALREIGFRQALRFAVSVPLRGCFSLLGYPAFRTIFLRCCGVRVGRGAIIHGIRFFNIYRGWFSALTIGSRSFLGDDCLLDLAAPITLGNNVTLAERVSVLTHTNVGYRDHPLQPVFPSMTAAVRFEDGCFVGANVTVLPGITVGRESFVAAGSVVTRNVPPRTLVAGVPAKPIRNF